MEILSTSAEPQWTKWTAARLAATVRNAGAAVETSDTHGTAHSLAAVAECIVDEGIKGADLQAALVRSGASLARFFVDGWQLHVDDAVADVVWDALSLRASPPPISRKSGGRGGGVRGDDGIDGDSDGGGMASWPAERLAAQFQGWEELAGV
jgi:hypothetical protein